MNPSDFSGDVTGYHDQENSGDTKKKSRYIKKQKGLDASHLLNFQFERSAPVPQHDMPISRRERQRSRGSSMTQAQFLQMNFKFVVHPLANPCQLSLYDPDVLVPWTDVVEVAVSCTNEEVRQCPICLDDTRMPKITRCGHIFCFACVLRYLDIETERKCPMCAERICRPDLRNVRFIPMMLPEENQNICFQKLHCKKGSLAPFVPDVVQGSTSMSAMDTNSSMTMMYTIQDYCPLPPPTTTTTTEDTIFSKTNIPMDGSTSAPYSRVVAMSMSQLVSSLEGDISQLNHLREEALDTNNPFRDTECLPYIAEALHLVTDQLSSLLSRGASSGASDSGDRKGTTSGKHSESSRKLPATSHSAKMVAVSESAVTGAVTGKEREWYEFYQILDGNLVFLHPLCTKILNYSNSTTGNTNNSSSTTSMNRSKSVKNSPSKRHQRRIHTPSGEVETGCLKAGVGGDGDGGSDKEVAAKDAIPETFQSSEGAAVEVEAHQCGRSSSSSEEFEEEVLNADNTSDIDATVESADTTALPPLALTTSGSSILIQSVTPQDDSLSLEPGAMSTPVHLPSVTDREPSTAAAAAAAAGAAVVNSHDVSPSVVSGKVLEVERLRLTGDLRKRLPFLRHLPQGCEISLVEIDMRSLASPTARRHYQKELHARATKRRSRQKQQERERREDADAALAQAMAVSVMKESYVQHVAKKSALIGELLTGPIVGSSVEVIEGASEGVDRAEESLWDKGSGKESRIGSGAGGSVTIVNSAPKPAYASFAAVTQMMGSFPSLDEVVRPAAAVTLTSASPVKLSLREVVGEQEGLSPAPVKQPLGAWQTKLQMQKSGGNSSGGGSSSIGSSTASSPLATKASASSQIAMSPQSAWNRGTPLVALAMTGQPQSLQKRPVAVSVTGRNLPTSGLTASPSVPGSTLRGPGSSPGSGAGSALSKGDSGGEVGGESEYETITESSFTMEFKRQGRNKGKVALFTNACARSYK